MHIPAKVNLHLEVGSLRPQDGRHEIRTLFLPVPQLTDEVCVKCNPRGAGLTLELSGRPVPGGTTPETNLACRAVRAYCEEYGLVPDFHVMLHKRIPVSAGLGGGSADAAGTLLELENCTGRHRSPMELRPLAAKLGADIPFFLRPQPSLATGIGDILRPVSVTPNYELVIAYPGCPSPVAWAYQHWHRPEGLRPPAWPPNAEQLSSVEGLTSLVWNDLGFALEEKMPFLTMLREALTAAGALATAVSGSGSSVFGLARRGEGASIRKKLQADFPNLEIF